jgi:outer membrane receptor for ferrienterochelin and colicins
VPAFVWSPEVNASAVYRTVGDKFSASLYYKFTGRTPYYQLVTNGNGEQQPTLTEIGSFHWADVTLSRRLGKYFTLSGGLRNVFNVVSVTNSGTVGGAHSSAGPRPIGNGRSFFFNFTYSFNYKSNNS